MAQVAYNPNDPLEQAFLSALALGETGGVSNSATLGVGGADLTGSATDQYGFPQWQGFGNSHAAGTWQFQPDTWDTIAQEYNLDFTKPTDQAQGAWYLAEQTDPNLYSDLQSGNYSTVQNLLRNVWPSVTGNGAAPKGLANNLAGSIGSQSATSTQQTSGSNSGSTNPVNPLLSAGNDLMNATGLSGLFAQGALIVIGAVIIFVALWMLLSSQGVVPSPKDAAKAAVAL